MTHTPHVLRWPALGAVAAMALLAGALSSGCGSSGTSREAARDQATTATCQRYTACMMVGDGKTYPTLDDCEIKWKANWEGAWPASVCEDKIDQAQFDACLSAIGGTDCMSPADFLATLAKCGQAKVCDAPPADAGT